MIGRGFSAFFSVVAAGTSLQQMLPVAPSGLSLFIQNSLILGIATWALIELISQGKRMATRADVTKLRDDVTAVLTTHQDKDDNEFSELRARMDRLVERNEEHNR